MTKKISGKEWDFLFYEKERLSNLNEYVQKKEARALARDEDRKKEYKKQQDCLEFQEHLDKLHSLVGDNLRYHFSKDHLSTINFLIDRLKKLTSPKEKDENNDEKNNENP